MLFTRQFLLKHAWFYLTTDPLPNLSAGRVLLACPQFIPLVFRQTQRRSQGSLQPISGRVGYKLGKDGAS